MPEIIPQVSVVIPAFNSSEKALQEVCSGTATVLAEAGYTCEIIIVNDGGKKETWNCINAIIPSLPCKAIGLRLSKNYGQHNATLCGIENARAPFIITIDDDMQNPPSEIIKLIDAQKDSCADLVYGVYKNKKHSVVKNIGSAYVKKTSAILLDSPGEGSSFRLMTKSLAEKICENKQGFVYIDELLLWYTENIAFTPVEHRVPSEGKSRYSAFRLILMSLNITTNYTALPLKFITYLGLISSFISFLLGIYFIYRKFVIDVPTGYTSLIVTILFSTSIILMSLGILGQYIYKMYQVQQKRPSYAVSRKTENEI
jgi:glycosyltransferase involved in cell wall biosynthesis